MKGIAADRIPALPADTATVRDHLAVVLPPLVLALALLLLLALGLRLIDVGAADLSVVGLFSTDEQLAGQLVRAMLRQGNLGLSHFYSYGPLDLYAARLLLWPWSLLHSVSDEAIVVALRAVSLLSGLVCVAVTYVLGRRLWNEATGALAALLLALSPTLLVWSTTAHPDTLQLVWLLLGLLCAVSVVERRSRPALLLGTLCAVLAFATKYEGELLLPVLWLADLLRLFDRAGGGTWRARAARLPAFALDVALTLALFAGCFLLFDPSVLREPREFLYQAGIEAGLAHSGHLFTGNAAGPAWLGTLAGPAVLGAVLTALGAAGLTAWTAADLRSTLPTLTGGAQSRGRLLLVLWSAGYLLFLLVWIGDRQPRYALPLLPGLALFAAAALVWLARRSRATAALAAALLALAVVPVAVSLLQYEQSTAARMSDPLTGQRLAAGRWLAARVQPSTPILADAYAYLPPSLSDVTVTFGLTPAQIATGHPVIIVTDASIRDRFSDPSAAGRYVDGPDAYREIAATYDAIESGRPPCYPLLQQFGPEHIYGRLPNESQLDGC